MTSLLLEHIMLIIAQLSKVVSKSGNHQEETRILPDLSLRGTAFFFGFKEVFETAKWGRSSLESLLQMKRTDLQSDLVAFDTPGAEVVVLLKVEAIFLRTLLLHGDPRLSFLMSSSRV
ncbi:hypothetical protein AVEN_231445-1 [Araneus ventricosus]|uniref:Uncharacterized protein n=1 Tax=Araneus ventricosus TaxID=182803 RepID=A0A4Y2TIZ0_ARAVE|nr:hypothetical protein AVEN_231445-1 [Araneus ventricosus]